MNSRGIIINNINNISLKSQAETDNKHLVYLLELPKFNVKYGLLYNWYAAAHIENISSLGWRVGNANDYWILMRYIDGSGTDLNNVSAKELKETGTLYWINTNVSTNSTNFNARGAGTRSPTFSGLKQSSRLWNSDESYSQGVISQFSAASSYFLTSDPSDINKIWSTEKRGGSSIRLIKDSTTLSHGQRGTYMGNDGKFYDTICIGTQEWLANNLCETKYRNGDNIPEVTDQTTWAGLTTGALCAYNNDWSNV